MSGVTFLSEKYRKINCRGGREKEIKEIKEMKEIKEIIEIKEIKGIKVINEDRK